MIFKLKLDTCTISCGQSKKFITLFNDNNQSQRIIQEISRNKQQENKNNRKYFSFTNEEKISNYKLEKDKHTDNICITVVTNLREYFIHKFFMRPFSS